MPGWRTRRPLTPVSLRGRVCRLVIITMLILATLRLPVIFTALFTLVDLTLLLSLLQVGPPLHGDRPGMATVGTRGVMRRLRPLPAPGWRTGF